MTTISLKWILSAALTVPSALASAATPAVEASAFPLAKEKRILLAKKRRASGKARKRHLVGEVKKKRGSTSINFDEASIDGRRRLPAGVEISKNRPEHDYDLINLRLRWHPEMIQSTTHLDATT